MRLHTRLGRPQHGQRRAPVLAAVGLSVIAVSVAACGTSTHHPTSSGGGSDPSSVTIVIKNFAFSPATLTVSPGAKVTVHNEDPTTHTLTAVAPHNKVFNTGDINANTTATFTAPRTAGTYPYICLIHQFMHGTLIVR